MANIVVIGSMNMDYVINVRHMPLTGETLLCDRFETIPGGKGANQAYAAGKLGGQIAMLGAVGDDDSGQTLCDSLRSVGVDVSRIKKCRGENTGSAFICVDHTGDNSIIVAQGANREVDIAYIDANLDLLEQCSIVVLQLEIPLDTVVYAAKKAKALGKTVILDPAPARTDIPPALYACVDILKPNETEAAILTGVSGGEGSAAELAQAESSAQKLAAQGVKNVVVTLGGKGAFLMNEQGTAFFPADSALSVVDTTAAGDSFTGALALCLAGGKPIAEAIAFAVSVSGLVVTRKGAQTSIPTAEEVAQYRFSKSQQTE